MLINYFAAAESEGGILGFSPKSFVIQLITFTLIFILLRKFAFSRIVKVLEKRRNTIEDGVRLGEEMEKRKQKTEEEVSGMLAEARTVADNIIENANKEVREMQRESEKAAKLKADSMIAEAQDKIEEEALQAKRKVEKDVVTLVSEATEAVVHEKVDAKKDAELIDRALKSKGKK